MTKEELITNLILLGFVKSTIKQNRYKRGSGMDLMLVEFTIPDNAFIYSSGGYVGSNRIQIPYDKALKLCVKLLKKNS